MCFLGYLLTIQEKYVFSGLSFKSPGEIRRNPKSVRDS